MLSNILVPRLGFEPRTLPNLGTDAGYKPGVLPLNYRGELKQDAYFSITS